MPAYFFRSEPGAAELRRLARGESGRVCQRVLMIANMLEGMEHEEAARLAGLSRSAAYEWHNRYEEDGIEGLRDRPRPGRQPRVDAVSSARFKERIVAGADVERDGVVAFRAVDAQRIPTRAAKGPLARPARGGAVQSPGRANRRAKQTQSHLRPWIIGMGGPTGAREIGPHRGGGGKREKAISQGRGGAGEEIVNAHLSLALGIIPIVHRNYDGWTIRWSLPARRPP